MFAHLAFNDHYYPDADPASALEGLEARASQPTPLPGVGLARACLNLCPLFRALYILDLGAADDVFTFRGDVFVVAGFASDCITADLLGLFAGQVSDEIISPVVSSVVCMCIRQARVLAGKRDAGLDRRKEGPVSGPRE